MHPFCCVSPISNRNQAPPSLMPPSHSLPSNDAPAIQINGYDSPSVKRRDSITSSSSSSTAVAIHNHPNQNQNHNHPNQNQNHNHHNQIQYHNHNQLQHQQMSTVDQREVMINDIVGNGISGILYKWVNYGKGWRPRWFVLQDGVVSYYKIHGPDKITLTSESEKGFKVIGDESMRRIRRSNYISSSLSLRRKPFGEVHLKYRYLYKHCDLNF